MKTFQLRTYYFVSKGGKDDDESDFAFKSKVSNTSNLDPLINSHYKTLCQHVAKLWMENCYTPFDNLDIEWKPEFDIAVFEDNAEEPVNVFRHLLFLDSTVKSKNLNFHYVNLETDDEFEWKEPKRLWSDYI